MSRFMRAPRFDWGYLIVLGLTLPVLWPLVGPAYLSSHDGLHHLFRPFDLDWFIHGGSLYPRWLPSLGFGYAYPVLNYCAPLGYRWPSFSTSSPSASRLCTDGGTADEAQIMASMLQRLEHTNRRQGQGWLCLDSTTCIGTPKRACQSRDLWRWLK